LNVQPHNFAAKTYQIKMSHRIVYIISSGGSSPQHLGDTPPWPALGANPPAGSRGKALGQGTGGEAP